MRATVRDPAEGQRVRATVGADDDDRFIVVIADLNTDEGWDTAVAGCDYVLDVASPLGVLVADRNALIAPARDRTLRVSEPRSRRAWSAS